jgi:hypothetical protein
MSLLTTDADRSRLARSLSVAVVFVGLVALAGVAVSGGAMADSPAQSVTLADSEDPTGSASATINTTRRNVSTTTAAPGETVTIEVFVDTDGPLSGQELVQVTDQFSPAFDDVTLNDSDPGPGGAGGGPNGEEFRAVWNEDAENYTVSYDVTVPASASPGDQFDVTGTVEVGGATQALPSTTITVPQQTGVRLDPADASASPGGQTTFDVVAVGVDDGVTDYSVNVSSSDTSVASFSGVSLANQASTDNSQVASSGAWALVDADLGSNSHGAANEVVIAELTVDTPQAGTAALSITDAALGSSSGSYTIETTGNATLTASDRPTLPGANNRASDTTGDGKLNDANGDGSFTPADITILFNNRNSAAVQDNQVLFDFNGDGSFTPADVTTLFNQVL